VVAALFIAQAEYMQPCDDNTNEPPPVFENCCDGEVCASAEERCKSGLRNIRERYAANAGNVMGVYKAGTPYELVLARRLCLPVRWWTLGTTLAT
jgi:hypothetical protein